MVDVCCLLLAARRLSLFVVSCLLFADGCLLVVVK